MLPFDTDFIQKRHNVTIQPAGVIVDGQIKPFEGSDKDFDEILDRFEQAIHSPERKVTGSLFIKRYNSLIAAAIYVWTHHQYAIDMSLTRIRGVVTPNGMAFQIGIEGEFAFPESADSYGEKTAYYLRHVFSDNVCPVFTRIVKHTKAREANLWATLSYLFAYWKREWLRDPVTDEVRTRIQKVYTMMMEQAGSDWFEGKQENPLFSRFRQIEDPLHCGEHILLRDKCCMNYRLPGGDRYCYTCPLISDERRIEKYLAAHSSETRT